MDNETSYILKMLRQRLDLSQKDIASRVGVSRQMLNRWESQRSFPSCVHYFKWRDTLLAELQKAKGEKESHNSVSLKGGESQ